VRPAGEELPYIFYTKYTGRLEEERTTLKRARRSGPILMNGFYDHFEERTSGGEEEHEDISAWRSRLTRSVISVDLRCC